MTTKSIQWFLLAGMFVAVAHAGVVTKPFDDTEYEVLLGKMIAVSEQLQNHPEKGKIPKERLVADIVKRELLGLIEVSADPQNLTLQEVDLSVEQMRPHLIFKYHGKNPEKVVTFMGSHLDVVPADPHHTGWEGHNPFKLTKMRDAVGQKLIGRGVTDCLGHVAMLTLFLKRLAQERPKLEHSVVVIFISNEENGTVPNIGIDSVASMGYLKGIEKGPVYWVDASDTMRLGPLTGTGGIQQFHFTFNGKTCHSGLPSKGISAIDLQSEFICEMNRHFRTFLAPQYAEEKRLGYSDTSSCKATQIINGHEGALNQVLDKCTLGGDIRYTPLWEASRLKLELETFVESFNKKVASSEPHSHLGRLAIRSNERPEVGTVKLEWKNTHADGYLADMNGAAYRQAVATINDLNGRKLPGFALTGTLPLVAEMRREGFDLLSIGFGVEDAYHAQGEFGYLEDFAEGFRFVDRVIERMERGL